MKIYVETYGCWLNKADSDAIVSMLKEHGHEIVHDLRIADVVIVNTCAVRSETERKIAKRLQELELWKGESGDKKIIVLGCLAKARPAFIAHNSPSASIIGPNALSSVLKALETRIIDIGPDRREFFKLPRYDGSKRLTIPIAVGCLGSCSYCIMPISRGKLSSCPPERIVELFCDAVSKGVKEVYLVAQDLAAYGLDLGYDLPRLLQDLLKHEGDYMIRLGMMEPSTLAPIANDMVKLYFNPHIYKYLHLPLQSGSDRVLKLMNRKYTVNLFIKLVELFRSSIDDLFLATDVIVGFPTETDEDFEETCRVIERLNPDKVHVARYTMRPFTQASSMPQLSDHVKKVRSRILSEIVKEVTLKRNLRYVGREVEVLLTDVAPRGGLSGRMMNYRPVIVKCDYDMLWKKVTVLIEEAEPHVLIGRAV
ncbi:MAG: tRNA (N(6)-L-threonylcarbamoyladenosine(37)-C(2))-methylthiotransferase [Candidatus Nezhaarchaeales archaeon]